MKGGSPTQSTAGCRNECSYISHHRNVKHYIIDNTHYPPLPLSRISQALEGEGER